LSFFVVWCSKKNFAQAHRKCNQVGQAAEKALCLAQHLAGQEAQGRGGARSEEAAGEPEEEVGGGGVDSTH